MHPLTPVFLNFLLLIDLPVASYLLWWRNFHVFLYILGILKSKGINTFMALEQISKVLTKKGLYLYSAQQFLKTWDLPYSHWIFTLFSPSPSFLFPLFSSVLFGNKKLNTSCHIYWDTYQAVPWRCFHW